MIAPPTPRREAPIHGIDCRCRTCRLEDYVSRPVTAAELRRWALAMAILFVIAAIGLLG